MSKRRITAEMLTQKGAHCGQLNKFRKRFPDGLDLETVRPEEVVGLDVRWAVLHMLPAPAWKRYREARARAAIELFREHWQVESDE